MITEEKMKEGLQDCKIQLKDYLNTALAQLENNQIEDCAETVAQCLPFAMDMSMANTFLNENDFMCDRCSRVFSESIAVRLDINGGEVQICPNCEIELHSDKE